MTMNLRVSLLYVRGTFAETIARDLKPFNILIARKPTTALRRLLTNVKAGGGGGGWGRWEGNTLNFGSD